MTKHIGVTSTFAEISNKLRRFVSRIVSPDDVEDIVQETFIKSYEADLKQNIEFTHSYMLKTAKHIALNHVAKWDNKYKDSLDEQQQVERHMRTMALEDEVTSKERFLFFCRVTNELSPQVKKCFILKKVYGLSQKEIAKEMNLSTSTVEKHIAKGLLHAHRAMKAHDIQQNNYPETNTFTAKEVNK
ncbi:MULTISPECIES: RNA polymerase sigma factor [Pseudoalteromonas]|uniref:RNA polymerase sigma factor n=1 Tax=Pseudoalteromonas TaxID=53246 RepID=UPI00094F6B9F|nr:MULTISPECIES: sigma-70 family RNA polymerase sigma factor [Pseudoalteromonas]|tara:strand:+ start:15619 stop:16179 length:561 start_codon:yes stop_codon:yes gene_type:complete